MKLSFSTLGCPEWTFEEIVLRAKEYGYDGLELRGIGPVLDMTQTPAFSTASARESSVRLVEDNGLSIITVDTSTQLSRSPMSGRKDHLDHAKANIDLATEIGASFIRVFGGDPDNGVLREEAVDWCVEGLHELSDYAASAGDVQVVMETHDYFSRGAEVAAIFSQIDRPNVGVLWDLHHPYRQGESPEETYEYLKPWLKFAHVKDSIPGGTYCLLGEGDVPIKPMLDLLRGGGYDGWLSLEWEKRWVPELLAPEIAFPQYEKKLREYLG